MSAQKCILCHLVLAFSEFQSDVFLGKDLEILHGLWSAGIAADFYSYNLHEEISLEDVQEYCKHNHIKHMVTLKESEKDFIRLRSFEKDSKKDERFDDVNK